MDAVHFGNALGLVLPLLIFHAIRYWRQKDNAKKD